ncbi:MAG: gamma-glutamyltransferase [Polyangiaceae bacterium]
MKRCAALLLLVACTPSASKDADGRTPTAVPTSAAPVVSASAVPPAASARSSVAPPPPVDTGPRVELRPGAGRSVQGRAGIVVSVEKHATRVGVAVLEAGGNAVDAAIAAAYALAVTHPSAGNIGGGGFALVRATSGELTAVDFRETAPKALDRERFRRLVEARGSGPLSVGVPGTVAGLELMRERFASLPRERLMAPAIELARKGHRIGHREGLTIGWSWKSLEKNSAARRIFGPQGKPLASGDSIRNVDLADTLKAVAQTGSKGFYEGPVARRLSRATQGALTEADLAAYRAVVRDPTLLAYRGLQLAIMPPPSAGGVSLALIVKEMISVKAWTHPRDSADFAHLFLESSRRAQSRRRFDVRDPDSVDPQQRGPTLTRWLDPAPLLTTAPIELDRATPSSRVHPLFEAALEEAEHTTHLSVVDASGMAVSLTTTLSSGFGSKIVAEGTGVVLNNSVASFGSMGDNTPVGGQRTTSSMAPTVVTQDDKLVAILGSPGGDTIPSTVAQVLFNLADGQMALEDAVDAPRLHHGFVPDEVRYEGRRPPPKPLLDDLGKRGHRFSKKRIPMGDANNVVLVDGTAYGYADPREGGLALAAKPAAP